MKPSAYVAFALASALSVGGCTVGAPSTSFATQQSGTGTTGTTGTGDTGGELTTNPDMAQVNQNVDTPVLGTYSSVSAWTSVPLNGTADPNVTILITAQNGTTTDAQADGTGSFCVDLPLTADSVNVFVVEAVNSSGTHSGHVTATITQQGTAGTSGSTTQTSTNVALGATASAYYIGVDGQQSAQVIVDGDATTWLEAAYEGGDLDEFDDTFPTPYVQVLLPQGQVINKLIALAATDCTFNTPPTFYISDQAAPAAPGPSVTGWTAITGSLSTDGVTLTAEFAQTAVQNIALVYPALTEFSSGGGGCTQHTLTYYGIAELQAISVQGVTTPAQTAPTCSGGS